MFSDRSGEVRRRFTVAMQCSWQGEQGVLDEQFVYDDGERQRRVWRLRHRQWGVCRHCGRRRRRGPRPDHRPRLPLGYTLRLPVDGRVWEVDFDDWMFLIDDRVMLNRATMSKFGVRLGEVQLAFTKGIGGVMRPDAHGPGGPIADARHGPLRIGFSARRPDGVPGPTVPSHPCPWAGCAGPS